jgi:hypothetical protein
MIDNDMKFAILTWRELQFLRVGTGVYARNSITDTRVVGVVAEPGWAVDASNGFRALSPSRRGPEPRESFVWLSLEGSTFPEAGEKLCVKDGWAFYVNGAAIRKMTNDQADNKATTKARKESEEQAKAEEATTKREQQKQELLEQVEVLNKKIKELD